MFWALEKLTGGGGCVALGVIIGTCALRRSTGFEKR